MVKKSIYIGFSDFFFKLSQKIDLNMSEYVEFYGDHVFLVQMSPNIAQISIFINFIKNRIFYFFLFFIYFFLKGRPWRLGSKSFGGRGDHKLGWKIGEQSR